MARPLGCLDEAELQALIDGSLLREKQVAVADHLENCEDCRRSLESLAGDSREFPKFVGSPEMPHRSEALESAIHHLKAGTEATPPTAASRSIGPPSLRFLSPSANPRHLGRLGPYEILEVVGRGGMGTVLKARDSKLERLVAVKVLNLELASDGPARARFLREARSAAAVTHEHVVTIHAVDHADETPFLVMEYVVGVSLEDRLQMSGHLRVEEILRIGMQAASGLAAAHAQGLVHRDIKPSNILLENGVERVKITDFGLARVIHEALLTQTDSVAGTPQYMSPEQTCGESVDQRSDLFSLGCVLYAMCVGRSPFRAETPTAAIHRVRQDTPRPIRDLNPEIPEWLVAIVDRLLEKKPQDRFQTAGEVAEVLGAYLAHVHHPSRVRLPVAGRRHTVLRSPNGAVASAVCLALVLVVVLGLREAGLWRGFPQTQGTGLSINPGELEPADPAPPIAAAAPDGAPRKDPLPGAGAKGDEAEAGSQTIDPRKLQRILQDDIDTHYVAAQSCAVLGQWDRAAEEVAKALATNPNGLGSYRALAVAQLMAGDTAGYKATCAKAVRQLSHLGVHSKACAVHVCCLSADSGIGIDRIASILREIDRDGISTPKFDQIVGYYFLRSGRDEDLLMLPVAEDDPYVMSCGLLIRAIASQRLGRHADAGMLLERAVLTIEEHFASPEDRRLGKTTERWVHWGNLQLLLEEARQLILQEPGRGSGDAHAESTSHADYSLIASNAQATSMNLLR